MSEDYRQADADILKGHPLLQERWPRLEADLLARGFVLRVVEVYRPDLRQKYLYGAGRSAPALAEKGISPRFARPQEPRVTNAWSARTSAHGWLEGVEPAAAALDVAPVGKDGRPFTPDDPWGAFVEMMARIGPSHGLIQFHAPGKAPWDRPHVQLDIWCDTHHVVHPNGVCPERGDLRTADKTLSPPSAGSGLA